MIEGIYSEAARIADGTVLRKTEPGDADWDRRLDWLLTSRWTGFPIMTALLAIVLWLTVVGSNWPSRLLSVLLIDHGHTALKAASSWLALPGWLDGLLLDGCYLATAWVVAVMLPPMRWPPQLTMPPASSA